MIERSGLLGAPYVERRLPGGITPTGLSVQRSASLLTLVTGWMRSILFPKTVKKGNKALFLFFVISSVLVPASSSGRSLCERRISAADAAYRSLLRSKRRKLYRCNWVRVSKLYRSSLRVCSRKRPYIYSRLSNLYKNLYRISGRRSDLLRSIKYRHLLKASAKKKVFVFSTRYVSFSYGSVTLFLPRWVSRKVFYLASPYRVVVDIWPSRFREGFYSQKLQGSFHRMRISQRRGDVVRVVFLVDRRVKVKKGRNFVLLKSPENKYFLSYSGIKTIVIDPGHGGIDPGAIGPTGLKEKWVTLDIARRLYWLLKSRTDLRVYMTRSTDRYVSLENRVTFAERVGADLFISIHSNASKNRRLSGLEIYYADPYRSYEKVIGTGRRGVRFLLADLRDESKLRISRELSLKIRTSVLRKTGLRDNGVRKAPYYVLLNSRIPSLLVEAGYVSNPWEERKLKNPRFRQAIAEGIFYGIVDYLSKRKNVVEARLWRVWR